MHSLKLIIVAALLGLVDLTTGWPSSLSLMKRDFDPDKTADDKIWGDYQCKGEKLMAAMTGSDAEAGKPMGRDSAESTFKGDLKGDLATWSWTEKDVMSFYCDYKGYWNLDSPFTALGLDSRPKAYGGPNLCYHFLHYDENKKDDKGNVIAKKDQKYTVQGKEYSVTGADSQIGMDPNGAIHAHYTNSPLYAARNLWNREPSSDELPELRALSDLMWGAWNRENPDITNIKYFGGWGIGNKDSKAIMARALKEAGKTLEKWPGVTFDDMKSEAALALLGSPNGARFGFFLAQHKAELGNKVIAKIQVFKSDANSEVAPGMLFYVGDAPKASGETSKDGTLSRRHVFELLEVD